ncbi:POU domain, class 6, transcription factor 2, partial [Larimichthys crocea]
ESVGQPGSSGSSHGIHRRLSGVWKHPVKPARSHRTAGHQRTRTDNWNNPTDAQLCRALQPIRRWQPSTADPYWRPKCGVTCIAHNNENVIDVIMAMSALNYRTAPSEVDGVNLEEIREFAKAFKIRRLSLGLTQTQVGQALSAAEGPAYSQSAICRHTILRSHFFLPQEAQENTIGNSLTGKLNPGLLYPARFEKLDITPKSAQKIKPVLERWMAEAEARHRSGMQNLTEFIGSEPSKKRKRRTSFTPQALEILNSHFEKNTHPSGQEMTEIAEKLNYDREVVRVWFCNKRQALKNTIKRLKQPDLGPAAPMDPLTDSLEELPK